MDGDQERTFVPVDDGTFTDDELTALALAADPDPAIDDDAVPLRFGEPGAELLPSWYMPAVLGASPRGRRSRGRVLAVGGTILALLIVNGAGLCVTYGFPEIAW